MAKRLPPARARITNVYIKQLLLILSRTISSWRSPSECELSPSKGAFTCQLYLGYTFLNFKIDAKLSDKLLNATKWRNDFYCLWTLPLKWILADREREAMIFTRVCLSGSSETKSSWWLFLSAVVNEHTHTLTRHNRCGCLPNIWERKKLFLVVTTLYRRYISLGK